MSKFAIGDRVRHRRQGYEGTVVAIGTSTTEVQGLGSEERYTVQWDKLGTESLILAKELEKI
jgi:hypothetical protein